MKSLFCLFLVGLFYIPLYPQIAGDLRQDPSVGFLEVWNGSEWAMVCDDIVMQGDMTNRINIYNVICRRLSGVSTATIVNSNGDGDIDIAGELTLGPCQEPIELVEPYIDDSQGTPTCPSTGDDLLTDCTNIAFVTSGCFPSDAFCVECMVNGQLVRDFPFQDNSIPTLSQWGIILLSLCLAIVGLVGFKQGLIKFAHNYRKGR